MPLHSICRALIALLFSLALLACSKREPAPNAELPETYARGDRVVVESSAAEFFEGRVLAVSDDHLRVQATGGNDSVNVPASDVYRLPPEPREVLARALAICGRGDVWQPCRVQNVTAAVITAGSTEGETFDLPRERVLVPSALTELNLKRYFERNEAQLAFSRSAERAGDPRPEPGWHPSAHERLLVKLGSDWFTAYVHELGEDTVVVTLSSGQTATVPVAQLVAEPPSGSVNDLRRGDFVLLRPDSASQAWPRWQIRAVNDKEIKLGDATAVQRSATIRDVLVLKP